MPEENCIEEVKAEVQDKDRRDCSTCKWWTRARPIAETVEVWGMEMFAFGECRGTPPSALPGERKLVAQNDPDGETYVLIKQARFPHTYHNDWCGWWAAKA